MEMRFLKKSNRFRSLVLWASLIVLIFSASAQATPLAPIKDTDYVFTGDSEITVPTPTSDNIAGIILRGPYTVTAPDDAVITINVESHSGIGSFDSAAILVYNGGTVRLGKVIITTHANNGRGTGGIGAYGNGSNISVGDYSIIDASSFNSTAVFALTGGIIEIGNHAVISSNIESGAGASAYGLGSAVNIGDNAVITNPGAFNRLGIYAYVNGSIDIGDDAYIEIDGTASGSTGVSAGTVITPFLQSKGTITIGDGAEVVVKGTSSVTGIAAYYVDSSLIVGENASISVNKTASSGSGYGIIAVAGATVTVGSRATVETTGSSTYGVMAWGEAINGTPLAILGATVNLGANSSVETAGTNSHGLYYYQTGYIGLGDGTTITTHGLNADAMRFSGELFSNGNPIPFVYSGITMRSDRGYLIVNDTGEDLKIAFSGASKLYGNIINGAVSGTYGTTTLYLSGTSFFQGESKNTSSHTGAMVNLDLSGNGYWHVVDDYKIDNINMAGNGRILFNHDDTSPSTFYTANVASITGTGIFELNVNMDGTGSGDLLSITDATGTYKLKLNDKTVGTGIADGFVVVEIANAPTGLNISLLEGKVKTLGGTKYELKANADLTEWYLSLFSGPDPDIVDGTYTSMIGLFEFAKAIDATISDELLSAKKTVWAIAGYKRQNFRDLSTSDDINQNIFSIITGMDIASKDDWNFGAFIGLSIGNQNVDKVIVATTDSFTLGFNATYENNGLLASGYVRLANYLHSIEVVSDPSLMKGRMNAFGFSASVQAIKNFYIADTGIFVAPKAKLSFTHIFGFEHDFDYFTVTGKPASALVAWAGGRIGYDLSIRDIPVTPYVEAGFMYDTNPKITVFVDGEEEEMNISGIRYEVGLGFTIIPSEASSFTFEYKFASSKNLVEPIKIKISATTSF